MLLPIEVRLRQVGEWSGQFVPAIGAAIYIIALYLFYFQRVSNLLRTRRACDRSFPLEPGDDPAQLRRETSRLMVFLLPVTFILISAVTYDPAALAGVLSRLFFVRRAVVDGLVLHPHTGAKVRCIARVITSDQPGNLLSWLRYLWPVLGLILLVGLAVLAIAGLCLYRGAVRHSSDGFDVAAGGDHPVSPAYRALVFAGRAAPGVSAMRWNVIARCARHAMPARRRIPRLPKTR